MYCFIKENVKIFICITVLLCIYPEALFSQSIEQLKQMTLEELMDVEIISASKKEEIVKEIAASVIIITSDEIERYGYSSLVEILRNVPGLFSHDDYSPFGPRFGIRGFFDEQIRNIIFLVDGFVRQVEPISGGVSSHLIDFPVESLDRIEIIRGPLSVIYGTGAFFGAINLVTNDNSRYYNSLVSASYGSHDTRRLTFRSAGIEEGFKYSLNASTSSTNGLNSDYAKMGTQLRPGKTGGDLSNKRNLFSFSGSFNNFTGNMSFNEVQNPKPIFVQPDENYDAINRLKQFLIGIRYKKEITDKVSIEGRFQYGYHDRNYDYDFGYENAQEIEKYWASSYSMEFLNLINPSPDISIINGILYNSDYDIEMAVDAPIFGFERGRTFMNDSDGINLLAFYSQTEYKMSESFSLTAGFRLERQLDHTVYFENNRHTQWYGPDSTLSLGDYFANSAKMDNHKIDFIPRIAGIFSLNNKTYFKLLYGKAINRPNFFMMYNVAREKSRILDPEWIETYELNCISNISPKIGVNLSLFRNQLDDLIIRSAGFNSHNNYYTFMNNAGNMTTNGIEGQLQLRPDERTNLDIAAIYQKTSDNTYEDLDAAYSPDFLGYMKFAYSINNNLSIALTGNYVGSMLAQWDNTPLDQTNSDSSPVGRIGEKTDSYFMVGSNLRMNNVFHKNIYLNLHISNLLDKEFYYPISNYSTWAQKGTFGLGRSLLLSAGITY